jgi:hypothetical protein
MNVYSPFHDKPLEQWPNTNSPDPHPPGAADGRRGIPSSEYAGAKSDGLTPIVGRAANAEHLDSNSGRAVSNSPVESICIVRCRIGAQHIRFETLPQSDSSPGNAAGSWRGSRFTWWLTDFPAYFSLGRFCNLCGGTRTTSTGFFASRVQPSKQALRSFTVSFYRGLLLGFFGLHDQKQTTRESVMRRETKRLESEMSSVELAQDYVRRMVENETRGWGDTQNALRRLEARYKLSYWSLDGFRTGRWKTVEASIFDRIQSAFADQCKRHAARLLHDAEIAMAGNPNDDVATIQDEIRALASRLEAAKSKGQMK